MNVWVVEFPENRLYCRDANQADAVQAMIAVASDHIRNNIKSIEIPEKNPVFDAAVPQQAEGQD